MSKNLSLAEGTEFGLERFVQALRDRYNPDPRTNPEYRQFLLDNGMTEEEIEEVWPSAVEG